MRSIALATLLSSVALGSTALAHAQETLNYNVANIQAEASRQVTNDQMHVVLFIEKNNKQPTELSSQITGLMNQALNIAKKYPKVKIETGSQTTYPVYLEDNQKLKEWRGRAEINLESTDFKAASQLMSELQQSFQTQSVRFTVSDLQRQKVENELILEASKAFQQRAQLMSQAWNKTGYTLVNINLNTSNYYPQPVMVRASMAKFSNADVVESQNIASGESKITVNASGSIQFK